MRYGLKQTLYVLIAAEFCAVIQLVAVPPENEYHVVIARWRVNEFVEQLVREGVCVAAGRHKYQLISIEGKVLRAFARNPPRVQCAVSFQRFNDVSIKGVLREGMPDNTISEQLGQSLEILCDFFLSLLFCQIRLNKMMRSVARDLDVRA